MIHLCAIKLLQQSMKVFERVLEKRIRCQVSIDNMHFGFMPGKVATYAIFIMRQVQEKHQANKKLYYAFVDLEKAFYRVPREVVRWALRKLGVDEWLSFMCGISMKHIRTNDELRMLVGVEPLNW